MAGHGLRVAIGLDPLPRRSGHPSFAGRHEVFGQWFDSLEEVAEHYSLSDAALRERMKKMSLEEAVSFRPFSGRYTEAKFAADPQMAARQATLYFVRVSCKDGELHKIGITTRSIRKRLGPRHSVIAAWRGALIDVFRAEQAVMACFRDKHYRAEDEFAGKTETFIFLTEEEGRVIEAVEADIAHSMAALTRV
jgi:hypothetical protein